MRVIPMEAWLPLFDLLLVVDDLEHAGAELSSELAEDAVSFERLDDKVFEFVH